MQRCSMCAMITVELYSGSSRGLLLPRGTCSASILGGVIQRFAAIKRCLLVEVAGSIAARDTRWSPSFPGACSFDGWPRCLARQVEGHAVETAVHEERLFYEGPQSGGLLQSGGLTRVLLLARRVASRNCGRPLDATFSHTTSWMIVVSVCH